MGKRIPKGIDRDHPAVLNRIEFRVAAAFSTYIGQEQLTVDQLKNLATITGLNPHCLQREINSMFERRTVAMQDGKYVYRYCWVELVGEDPHHECIFLDHGFLPQTPIDLAEVFGSASPPEPHPAPPVEVLGPERQTIALSGTELKVAAALRRQLSFVEFSRINNERLSNDTGLSLLTVASSRSRISSRGVLIPGKSSADVPRGYKLLDCILKLDTKRHAVCEYSPGKSICSGQGIALADILTVAPFWIDGESKLSEKPTKVVSAKRRNPPKAKSARRRATNLVNLKDLIKGRKRDLEKLQKEEKRLLARKEKLSGELMKIAVRTETITTVTSELKTQIKVLSAIIV